MAEGDGPHTLGQLPRDAPMDPLHAQLLSLLEAGRIHPEEMEQFRSANQDETVDRELMWLLFCIEQLENHRLRLVEHLRALRATT